MDLGTYMYRYIIIECQDQYNCGVQLYKNCCNAKFIEFSVALLTHCIATNCNSPPFISNGSPGTPTRTTYGGTVTYSCNIGYVLSGSAIVRCLASGSWSTEPTCQRKIIIASTLNRSSHTLQDFV